MMPHLCTVSLDAGGAVLSDSEHAAARRPVPGKQAIRDIGESRQGVREERKHATPGQRAKDDRNRRPC